MISSSNSRGFQPRPVKDTPAAFGFGFGLGSMSSPSMPSAGWQPQPLQPQASGFNANSLASTSFQNSPSRSIQKRKLEDDGGVENMRQDVRMERSPTPGAERPKRAAPKRARISPSSSLETISKSSSGGRETKSRSDGNDQDVDVGMLLASLPQQSLLPIITALIQEQPSLKPRVLSLIPRPTLDATLQTLGAAARKLREAYPYSNPTSTFGPSVSFGFGGGGFPSNSVPVQPNQSSGMRDSYIESRLRPHITEFVNTTTSYLPYFSSLSQQSGAGSSTAPLHKDKGHIVDSFTFLYNLTRHIFAQPALTQSSLVPQLNHRLSQEWAAWVERVNVIVNNEGGMFGRDTVQNWERGLDELAGDRSPAFGMLFRNVRDTWVSKVGWLVGRTVQHAMEEL
ncbi:putative kinase [Moniliophthora roreri MCA 2997]|uniref:Tethering factor for nuclear proteasome STS1 n=1 Tax=Moniliophthora roreri (strain MCA 2997) TaxID=1381753 RepID=V2XFM5_MONRO|nr:putative kinase [Moniliophthora roreri MCA 2997]